MSNHEKKNPYNFNNKLLPVKFISDIFRRYNINYDPINLDIYQNAFVHKSYSLTKNKPEEIVPKPEGAFELMETDNERMEFLGDSILSSVITTYLFQRFTKTAHHEGFLTQLRTKLVNGEALGYFASELGFGEYIIMSRHIEDKCNGRKSFKLLEDVFEAFIGAIYLDFNDTEIPDNQFNSGIGYYICELFITNIIEEKVNFEDIIYSNTNYKEQLIRFYHTKYQVSPVFKLVSSGQEEHVHNFVTHIIDGHEHALSGTIVGIGEGRTKKKSEQNAAKNALIKLKQITE